MRGASAVGIARMTIDQDTLRKYLLDAQGPFQVREAVGTLYDIIHSRVHNTHPEWTIHPVYNPTLNWAAQPEVVQHLHPTITIALLRLSYWNRKDLDAWIPLRDAAHKAFEGREDYSPQELLQGLYDE